jgi:hypothetical protein
VGTLVVKMPPPTKRVFFGSIGEIYEEDYLTLPGSQDIQIETEFGWCVDGEAKFRTARRRTRFLSLKNVDTYDDGSIDLPYRPPVMCTLHPPQHKGMGLIWERVKRAKRHTLDELLARERMVKCGLVNFGGGNALPVEVVVEGMQPTYYVVDPFPLPWVEHLVSVVDGKLEQPKVGHVFFSGRMTCRYQGYGKQFTVVLSSIKGATATVALAEAVATAIGKRP